MKNIKKILTEDVNLYQGDVILKNKVSFSQKDIFNQIRGIPKVIVVTPVKDEFLDSKASDDEEFALIKIKYISTGEPLEDLELIKRQAIRGGEDFPKTEGITRFIIRPQTIHSVYR
jgi:hypothetical protein